MIWWFLDYIYSTINPATTLVTTESIQDRAYGHYFSNSNFIKMLHNTPFGMSATNITVPLNDMMVFWS